MRARIAFVRHGETDWNAEGRLQGSMDIPLNDAGRGQARAAGLALAAEEWDVVVSSPLSRAVETAELIGEAVGVAPSERITGLVERSYGAVEGLVSAGLARSELDELLLTAEPEDEVARRGAAAVREIARRHPGRRVIAVAHGTLIRLTLRELGIPREARIQNGEIVRLDTGGVEIIGAARHASGRQRHDAGR